MTASASLSKLIPAARHAAALERRQGLLARDLAASATPGPRLEGAPPPSFEPIALPKPDFVREGQPYWHLGAKPHTTRDRRDIALVGWQAFCPDCREPFVCTVPEGREPENRRCTACRCPGRRVAGTRAA